ncbi:MAG TPA: hypothetical protein VMM18_02245 [Gemmatimonadaceae bacterium]|nr:hypothetical protein [Gemmatimonadaceae bacterium]
MSRLATLAVIAAALAPLPLGAQRNLVVHADSLLSSGRVLAAETLYYQASRERPRDPAARLALGRYLAARGALRVGAVLMEEARYFGGDPAVIAAQLAPVYARLGEWRALASLPGSSLSYAERARAEFLREEKGTVTGPDTTTLPYTPEGGPVLGSILMAIGDDTVEARIDPTVQGLVLDSTWAGREELRIFKSQFDTDISLFAAVAPRISIGATTVTQVPARFDMTSGPRNVRLGLDVLAAMTPTFDPTARTVTLRRAVPPPGAMVGVRHQTLTYPSGVWIIDGNGIRFLTSESGRELIGGARWTLDARRGEIVVHR